MTSRTITRHRDLSDTWATCQCGWTSSPQVVHDLEHQIEAHLKWCQAPKESNER